MQTIMKTGSTCYPPTAKLTTRLISDDPPFQSFTILTEKNCCRMSRYSAGLRYWFSDIHIHRLQPIASSRCSGFARGRYFWAFRIQIRYNLQRIQIRPVFQTIMSSNWGLLDISTCRQINQLNTQAQGHFTNKSIYQKIPYLFSTDIFYVHSFSIKLTSSLKNFKEIDLFQKICFTAVKVNEN